MSNPYSPVSSAASDSPAAQQRTALVHLFLKATDTPSITAKDVESLYHFSTDGGQYFFFLLRFGSKVYEPSIPETWLHHARTQLRNFLSACPGDFETIITARHLFGICSTSISAEEVRHRMESIFHYICDTTSQLTAVWTLCLGPIVSRPADLYTSLCACRQSIENTPSEQGLFLDASELISPRSYLTSEAERIVFSAMLLENAADEFSRYVQTMIRKRSFSPDDRLSRQNLFSELYRLSLVALLTRMPASSLRADSCEAFSVRLQAIEDPDLMLKLLSDTLQLLSSHYLIFLNNGRSRPVWQIVEYIRLHMAEKVTLSDLSSIVNRNPQYISYFFRRDNGMTISEYVTAFRIAEAKRMLEATDLSPDIIASSCGFEDPKYFSRVFSRSAGISPAAYRARFRDRLLPV